MCGVVVFAYIWRAGGGEVFTAVRLLIGLALQTPHATSLRTSAPLLPVSSFLTFSPPNNSTQSLTGTPTVFCYLLKDTPSPRVGRSEVEPGLRAQH